MHGTQGLPRLQQRARRTPNALLWCRAVVSVALLGVLTVPAPLGAQTAGTITTVAGGGISAAPPQIGDVPFDGDGQSAVKAILSSPERVAVDASGSIYVSDTRHRRVRKVTPDGIINTVVGGGQFAPRPGDFWTPYLGDGGPATATDLGVNGLAVDASGALILGSSYRVLRVSPSGEISTVAGTGPVGFRYPGATQPPLYGEGGSALLAEISPTDVALGPSGEVFVADPVHNRVLRVGTDGALTSIAGTDSATSSSVTTSGAVRLSAPGGVVSDGKGGIYIADSARGRVLRVTSTGAVQVMAGGTTRGFSGDGGQAAEALLNRPMGLALDGAGSLFIADMGNNRIRVVRPDGVIDTVAGSGPESGLTPLPGSFGGDGGPAKRASLSLPVGVAIDSSGNLLIADSGNDRVRKVFGVAAPLASPAGTVTLHGRPAPPNSFAFSSFARPLGIVRPQSLRLVGNAATLSKEVRLTDRTFAQSGALWYGERVPVREGFLTTFGIRISTPSPQPATYGGDGIAFLVQGYSGSALSNLGGGMGYGDVRGPEYRGQTPTDGYFATIPDALVLEMDVWRNNEFSDPNANHLALHSTRATKEPLSERTALGLTAAIPALADGAEHTVRLHYFPGTLTVFMDDMQRPVIRVPANLEEELLLEDGLAWVGFTASNASGKQMQFIESWLFDAGTSALPPLGLMGDVNGDSKVDAVDASILLEAILGLQALSEAATVRADVDHSGSVDLKDLRGVLSTAAWAASR